MSARAAALGFSVHTGWAMAVAASGPMPVPKLLHRARIDLGLSPESSEVFHVAAEMAPAEAKRHVERCTKMAAQKARAELQTLATALTASPRAVGVVVSKGALPSSLDAVLRSHLMIHGAEGALYRTAILDAARELRLKVRSIPANELAESAAAVLKLAPSRLPQWLTDFGRTVGRPWGRDEKDAFLAACLALDSA
jgi:hypothetical protein